MKHRFFSILSLCALVLSGVSCSDLLGDKEFFYPFQSSKDGNWGLISEKGKVLAEDEFKSMPTFVINERFFVQNADGLWEIYKANEKLETVGEEYLDIIEFVEDVTPAVKKGERITLIDRDGNVKTTLEKADGKNIISCQSFSYGVAVIGTDDGLFGAINTKGEVVLSPKYHVVFPFGSNKFMVVKEKDLNKEKNESVFTFVDNKGKDISDLKIGEGQKYVEINLFPSDFEHNRIAVATKVDDQYQWGYISLDKEVIVKPSAKIKSLGQMVGDNFTFSDGNSWGVRNIKGEVVLRPKYEFLSWVNEETLVASKTEDEYDLINLKGDVLTKESYKDIWPIQFGGNLPVQISDNSYGFINLKGEEISDKDLPNIYNLQLNRKFAQVESDFVDYDAIISQLRIEKESLLGFNLSATPQQMIQTYNALFYSLPLGRIEEGSALKTSAEENRGRDRLELAWKVAGNFYYGLKVYYTGYMTQYNYYSDGVSWSNDKPAYIESVVEFDYAKDKPKKLFDKIVAKVKPLGSVVRQNSGAIIVKLSDNRAYIVTVKGDRVNVRLVNNDSYKYYDISEYAAENEQTEAFEVLEEAAVDYLEADSAVADIPAQ